MLHHSNLRDAFNVCDAIGSEVRLEILEQILMHKNINIDTIAKNLHLTNGALTKHIKKLKDAGLIRVREVAGKRGYQKQCSMKVSKLLIDLSAYEDTGSLESSEIPLGLYSTFKANDVCGLANETGYIGMTNESNAFLSPLRATAEALWVKDGYLTYPLPAPREKSATIEEIRISLEITPLGLSTHSQSQIEFLLDSESLGSVKIYPQSTARKGFLTPQWFNESIPSYGTVRHLRITNRGSFVDGDRISGVTPKSFFEGSCLTIKSTDGFVIFGKKFGDFNQAIRYELQLK